MNDVKLLIIAILDIFYKLKNASVIAFFFLNRRMLYSYADSYCRAIDCVYFCLFMHVLQSVFVTYYIVSG